MKSVTRCTWTEDSDGCWRTDCGNFADVNEGLPSANGMKYCWYCGKRLVEFPHKEEEKMIQTYDLTLDGRLLSNKKGDGLLVYTADHLAALAEKDEKHQIFSDYHKVCLTQDREQIAKLKVEMDSTDKAYQTLKDQVFDQQTTNGILSTENKRLRAIMVEHAGKCRGWFGENTAWEEEMFPEEVLLRRIEEREKS